MTPPPPDLFIILSGGSGSRLGGVDKAVLDLGGQRLLDRALAVAGPRPVILVGPAVPVPATVLITREDPAGGGPAAGLAAGVAALAPDEAAQVAVLAVDQAGVTEQTWQRLAEGAAAAGGGGAVLTSGGRRQYGVALIRYGALRAAVAARESWHGRPLRELLDACDLADVPGDETEARDIDTLEDLSWWQARQRGGGELDDGSGPGIG